MTGIQNEDKDIGLTYGYNSKYLQDEMSVLIKQFKTDVKDVEWTTGYGPEEDLYPAMSGAGATDYSAKVQVYCEKGVDRFTQLDMVIGPGKEGIIFRYDFSTDTFRKINDPLRLVVLKDDLSMASPYKGDPDFEAVVEFRYDFNLNWQSMDHTTVEFRLSGFAVKSSSTTFENQFRVISHVKMVGNLTVYDGRGKELQKGDWVRGGDTLHFSGLERRYADDSIPISPPDIVKIGIRDIPGNIYTGADTSELDTYVYVDPVFGEMDYRLIFINVTPEADESDDTKVKVLYTNGFLVQIDSDNPGIPGRVDVLPDDVNDKPRDYDNDRDVFIRWEDAIDQSSGVVMYYYSINKAKDRATDPIPMPKSAGSNVAELKNLPEGMNRIYIWAEDAVGNVGNEVFVDITIDLVGVVYSGFYPTTDVWNTQIRPTCSIFINDTLTGVDPLTIEYEISTSSVGFSENWQNIQDSYAPSKSLRVVVTGFFKNGKDNWIRFRAQDLAENKYQVSDAFNVWVDAEQPKFEMVSHSEGTYHLLPTQEVRILITDKESGVDASTIEYRLTTKGQTDWTPWRSYKDGLDGKSVEVRITETFRRGDQNFVQVRALDLAGNPVRTSDAFNIRINTFPEAVVTSPSSGDILYDDTDIVFDASDSYDLDSDKLTFSWYYSKGDDQVKLADVARYITPLDIGEYTITLVVKDRMDNEVQRNFVITVEKRISEEDELGTVNPTIDTDLDGMKDWFEIKYKLDPLVKDAGEDPDGDGYTNYEEFGNGKWYAQNLTNPKDPRSHPTQIYLQDDPEDKGPFSDSMLPLWGILVLLILVVVVTMAVMKNKKDKQVKRIRSVRNMRKIMPSVSWDQITTTAYMAPYVQGERVSPALPTAAPLTRALPPAANSADEDEKKESSPSTTTIASSLFLVFCFLAMNLLMIPGGSLSSNGSHSESPGGAPSVGNSDIMFQLEEIIPGQDWWTSEQIQLDPNDFSIFYSEKGPVRDGDLGNQIASFAFMTTLGSFAAGGIVTLYLLGKRKGDSNILQGEEDGRSRKGGNGISSEYLRMRMLNEAEEIAVKEVSGSRMDTAYMRLKESLERGNLEEEEYSELKRALDLYNN